MHKSQFLKTDTWDWFCAPGSHITVIKCLTDSMQHPSGSSAYRPQSPARRCPPGWRWCQVHRDPDIRARWPEPRQRCWRPRSACGPWSAHTRRRCRCCRPERGGGAVAVPAWRPETPSAGDFREDSVSEWRENHNRTKSRHCSLIVQEESHL